MPISSRLAGYVSTVAAIVAALALPRAALACGGLFCSVGTAAVPPAPVDQTAERIIFDVTGEDVTAHVWISYTGPADEFAWIVPVHGVPTVGETDPALFEALDTATAPSIVRLPGDAGCDEGRSRGFSVGCADAASFEDVDSGGDDRELVTVYGSGATSNYTFSVIGAALETDLVDWLGLRAARLTSHPLPGMGRQRIATG
mgnify:CR=1 FL=1